MLGLPSDLSGHLKVLPLPLSSVTQVTSVELVTCKALLLNIACGGMCPYVVQCLEDEGSILIHVVLEALVSMSTKFQAN